MTAVLANWVPVITPVICVLATVLAVAKEPSPTTLEVYRPDQRWAVTVPVVETLPIVMLPLNVALAKVWLEIAVTTLALV